MRDTLSPPRVKIDWPKVSLAKNEWSRKATLDSRGHLQPDRLIEKLKEGNEVLVSIGA